MTSTGVCNLKQYKRFRPSFLDWASAAKRSKIYITLQLPEIERVTYHFHIFCNSVDVNRTSVVNDDLFHHRCKYMRKFHARRNDQPTLKLRKIHRIVSFSYVSSCYRCLLFRFALRVLRIVRFGSRLSWGWRRDIWLKKMWKNWKWNATRTLASDNRRNLIEKEQVF